jgi:CheY-like chemotaxis protein
MGAREVHLLLIEDNPSDVRLFQEASADMNTDYKLHVASNGAQALDILFQRGKYKDLPRPDLIVLDLNLPILSGHEVLNAIKAHHELSLIPVIVFSVAQEPSEIRKAYDLGASCYVIKPKEYDEFERVFGCFSDFWLKRVSFPPRALTNAQ